MEENHHKEVMNVVDKEEVGDTFREAVPTHFLFTVQAFSLLAQNAIEKYESNEFQAGGHKWKLSLYPNGNKNDENGGDDHISLYLMLVDSNSPPATWELNVFFKLFLLDRIRNRFLIRESDKKGKSSRFHEWKKVHGFSQFLSLAKFKDPSNGYLVDDTCIFGVEVFVSTKAVECLSMVKHAITNYYKWKIENFSNIKEECLHSETFTAEGHNWYLCIYPEGDSKGKNNSLSLFLWCYDCEQVSGLKICTNFKLRIRDQNSGKHKENSIVNHWFGGSSNDWGWPKFIGLDELKSKENGYLVNDTCIVETEVTVLGVVSKCL